MLESPFVSMVWTPNGIEGMVFTEVDLNVRTAKIGRIETSGQGSIILLSASSHKQVQEELDDRQIRAIGALGNLKLRELSVAIIGCGGTGSPLAEQVARMGVKELTLIDPDILDSASNLRRVVGSRKGDLGLKTSKAEIVGRNIRSVGLELEVKVLPLDVRTFEATKTIIDSDVVITTTDTHSSRSWINQIAYQYSLPVIDVGVKVGISRSGVVSGMPADVRILLSDTGCLWCRRVLNSDLIRAENLPKDERIELAAEGYIQGVLEPQASLTPLNFFASSVALLSLLRLYSSDDSAAASFIADGWEHYFAENSSAIDPLCVCSSWRRLGDGVMMTYLDSESVG